MYGYGFSITIYGIHIVINGLVLICYRPKGTIKFKFRAYRNVWRKSKTRVKKCKPINFKTKDDPTTRLKPL